MTTFVRRTCLRMLLAGMYGVAAPRVLKYFEIRPHGKLDLVVEAFNLLNRTNVSPDQRGVWTVGHTVADLQQTIEASAGRQIQFSIDFEL